MICFHKAYRPPSTRTASMNAFTEFPQFIETVLKRSHSLYSLTVNKKHLIIVVRLFAYAKTKTQISSAVAAQLISIFVFAIRIVQSLFYLNPKFQVSSHHLWLYSPVCVGRGRKPRRPVFSQRGSIVFAV